MEKTLALIHRNGPPRKPPIMIRCVESGEVYDARTWAKSIASRCTDVKAATVKVVLLDLSRYGRYAYGVHWERVVQEPDGTWRGTNAANLTMPKKVALT